MSLLPIIYPFFWVGGGGEGIGQLTPSKTGWSAINPRRGAGRVVRGRTEGEEIADNVDRHAAAPSVPPPLQALRGMQEAGGFAGRIPLCRGRCLHMMLVANYMKVSSKLEEGWQ